MPRPRILKTRNLLVSAVLLLTLGFAVLSVYSFAYPAYHTHQVRQLLMSEAVAALPPGAAIEEKGVTGRGSLDGYAIGRVELTPAEVLAAAVVPGGAQGWVTPIPDCGKNQRCWLSRAQDHILTWTVRPCTRVDCPTRSALVEADVARGGPKS